MLVICQHPTDEMRTMMKMPMTEPTPQPRNSGASRRHAGMALAIAALCLTRAGSARAGIADSPLPVLLPGSPTLLLYSITGVLDLPAV